MAPFDSCTLIICLANLGTQGIYVIVIYDDNFVVFRGAILTGCGSRPYLYESIRLDVDRGRGFVQQEHLVAPEQGPGKTDQLESRQDYFRRKSHGRKKP